MEKVLITGGSGTIGQALAQHLHKKGYEVTFLGRKASTKGDFNTFVWNIANAEIDLNALRDCDYIVHLAGANIGERRWTKTQKEEIINSRTKSTQLLLESLQKMEKKPKAFISASAVGYYGAITSEEIFTEVHLPANDFLGTTCRLWEQSVDQLETIGIRTVKLRTGMVLSQRGGALEKMSIAFKYGLGSTLGSGRQYMPWIHIDDLCAMYSQAIEDSRMLGAYNAVAPESVDNKTFTKMLGKAMKKPLIFPAVPTFLLKLIFGEMSDLLTKGSRVSSSKIEATGFQFQYPTLKKALYAIFQSPGC